MSIQILDIEEEVEIIVTPEVERALKEIRNTGFTGGFPDGNSKRFKQLLKSVAREERSKRFLKMKQFLI